MKLSALKTPLEGPDEEDGLRFEVPTFPAGEPPPQGSCRPLLPDVGDPEDLPVFCGERLIRRLVKNERGYRRKHSQHWVERCWFLAGSVRRAADGSLWGLIERILQAQNLTATAGSFEFSPLTWSSFVQNLEARGQIGMGWLHTHSLKFLAEMPGELEKEQSLSGSEKAMVDPAERVTRITSGLFLSSTDVLSAWKRGFGMPHHLTCVMDSDACLKSGRETPLSEVLGVWGWAGLRLRRRSIHIVQG
jgi:hypothetical protein